MLEELWGKGHVQVDDVTPQSAAYVAGYAQKKVYGRRSSTAYCTVDAATGEVLQERRPEFVAMSLKPGIGYWWYRKYAPNDKALEQLEALELVDE